MGGQECAVDLTKMFVVQAVTESHCVFLCELLYFCM